jgi:hypothetical protein
MESRSSHWSSATPRTFADQRPNMNVSAQLSGSPFAQLAALREPAATALWVSTLAGRLADLRLPDPALVEVWNANNIATRQFENLLKMKSNEAGLNRSYRKCGARFSEIRYVRLCCGQGWAAVGPRIKARMLRAFRMAFSRSTIRSRCESVPVPD